MNCGFCNKDATPTIVRVDGVFRTFYHCNHHGSLMVSWKDQKTFAISNGIHRIRNVPSGKVYVDVLKPQFKVLMDLHGNLRVTPENFEKKLKILLAFS